MYHSKETIKAPPPPEQKPVTVEDIKNPIKKKKKSTKPEGEKPEE